MTKHFADRINVSTSGKLQGCIRMPKTMEQNTGSKQMKG